MKKLLALSNFVLALSAHAFDPVPRGMGLGCVITLKGDMPLGPKHEPKKLVEFNIIPTNKDLSHFYGSVFNFVESASYSLKGLGKMQLGAANGTLLIVFDDDDTVLNLKFDAAQDRWVLAAHSYLAEDFEFTSAVCENVEYELDHKHF